MTWQDDEIAGPMGYRHCVLFDCARDALRAWPWAVCLPGNVCREVYDACPSAMLEEVNQNTGLAKYSPTHLYGYQSPAGQDFKLSLDPLMTGWIRRLKTESAIISFGRKKMISMYYGGAFLTNDDGLADLMEEQGHWNESFTDSLLRALRALPVTIEKHFEVIDLWDKHLEDLLIRVPAEQLMPWRAMRRAQSLEQRTDIVSALRGFGLAVGTNYPPLEGSNEWGDTVLNFPCPVQSHTVIDTCEVIKRVIYG